jgi:hypothetical protein
MGQNTVSRAAESGGLERPGGREVQAAWRSYVRLLLPRLSRPLDLRLVRTLRYGMGAVIRLRLRPQALWLTELGSLVLGTTQAPAAVKRLSRLLAAVWSAEAVEQWLLEQADALLAAQPTGEGLVTFDQSVVEKPESARKEGLCQVRSGKARRLGAGHVRPRGAARSGTPVSSLCSTGTRESAALICASTGASATAPCCTKVTSVPSERDVPKRSPSSSRTPP